MALIAFAMSVSWILVDQLVEFDSFGRFPLGLVLIIIDLVAFLFIGTFLKRKVES